MSRFKEIVNSVLSEERQIGSIEVYLNKWHDHKLNIKQDSLTLQGENTTSFNTEILPPVVYSYSTAQGHYIDADKEHDDITGFSLILDGDALSNNFKLKRIEGERYYVFPRGKNADTNVFRDRHPSDEQISKLKEINRVVIPDVHRYVKKLIVGRVADNYKDQMIPFITEFMLHFDDVPVEAFNTTGQRFIEYAKREIEKRKNMIK